ncbi:chromate efflux transporter [Paradesertivirga mongoliensis]|uniref:Chromate efflux transporter n=1 Tax=Paradesertivirga mongoliensis TaxID=2100740 RepID=A0ABW4ZPJ7_9SPHI|nr:chromate efflux transporter [Pedobacter mongoliensis]
MNEKARPRPLMEVAKLFLKLGCIGFGGPAVHIAMMEEEVVKKKKWISQQHFLDLVGATNLIPGPNSTEMTMHCGHQRDGWKGLIVAGICFILPAVIITGAIAWAYQQYGKLPQVESFIYGIKPAVIAVIFFLMLSLGRKALKSIQLGILGGLAFVLALYGISEIYILFGIGFLGILLSGVRNRQSLSFSPLVLLVSDIGSNNSNLKLFWIFLKVGSILYGSGYVLFAFLDAELVTSGLISKQELTDAIAIGQFTPGPVFSAATFIGWQIAGFQGALLATIGIFLPSFLFVAFLNPLIPVLRKSKMMSAFLDCVSIASVALILVICIEMGTEAITDWRTAFIGLLGFVAAFSFKKLNTAFIILGGGFLGYLLTFI